MGASQSRMSALVLLAAIIGFACGIAAVAAMGILVAGTGPEPFARLLDTGARIDWLILCAIAIAGVAVGFTANRPGTHAARRGGSRAVARLDVRRGAALDLARVA